MQTLTRKEQVLDIMCTRALPELFPLFFADFVLYMYQGSNNMLVRVCNFGLGLREGRFKDRDLFSSLTELEIQQMTMQADGIVGEALKRNQDIILHAQPHALKHNPQIDLSLVKEITLVTKLIRGTLTNRENSLTLVSGSPVDAFNLKS